MSKRFALLTRARFCVNRQVFSGSFDLLSFLTNASSRSFAGLVCYTWIMQLTFLPGELCLKKSDDGMFVISLHNEEVFRTKMEKKALTEYNRIRKDMEQQFPPTPISQQQKTELLLRYIATNFHSNTFKPPKKEKKAPGSTRTWG
jgi:hypothetical protein